MASDAQIRANRANAQKSTGARTPEGKERSRFNATSHNITGTVSLRSGPEKAAFDAYFERLIPDFHAATDLEYELASRVVDVMFRLARISTLEGNILASGISDAAAKSDAAKSDAGLSDATTAAPAPLTDTARAGIAQAMAEAKTFIRESRTINNLSLYEQRLSRTLRNDLATLNQLRSQRLPKGLAYPRPTVIRWVDDDGNDTLSPIPIAPLAPIGFVFSSPKTGPARPVLARPKVEIAA